MLKLQISAPSHEELFLRSYNRLINWALRLTNRNREQAEDLVHDAFIEFTLSQADLNSIQNLDSYLHGILRNMHMSRVRRAAQYQHVALSVADYDSAEISLRAVDVRDHLRVKEELRQICHYACVRKESSKAGSVLILRFFHGYYPSEISRVFLSSGRVVDKWLWIARREARAYLVDANSLSFMIEQPMVKSARASSASGNATDFLAGLRQAIFQSVSGECPTTAQLREMYCTPESATLNAQTLGHLVSCRKCLDEVNSALGLVPLSERHPADSAGKDTRSGGGPGGGATGTSGPGDATRQFKRRLRDVIEHKPQELRVAVNGFVLGTQNIRSDLCTLTLSLNLEEKLGFIEVLSEQDIRLMFLEVGQPPDGEVEQHKRIELSDGRTLETRLSFNTQWPTLHVAYHDPTFVAESEVESLESEGVLVQSPMSKGQSLEEVQRPTSKVQSPFAKAEALWTNVRRRWSDFGLWTLDVGLFLRPSTVTALLALALIGVLLFVGRQHTPAPVTSASALLAQAAATEANVAARTDQVLHRTVALEEKGASGAVIARNKIEVWQSAVRGLTARRIYDEKSRLVAGDWRRADGIQTLYHHGSRPRLQMRNPQSAIRNFENAWQLDLTAQDFAALVKNAETLKLNESASAYVLTYWSGSTEGLRQATLVLSRPDLHATEQTFVVRQGHEERTYHYLETSFERRPTSAVAPGVFEPEPVLLGTDTEMKREVDTANMSASPRLPFHAAPVASTALELEVLQLLNRVDAFMGEQLSVARTPEGSLRVDGIVDTEKRKSEIMQALASVKNNPSVRIEVETAAEAATRQLRQSSNTGQLSVSSVEVEARKAIPAEADLRAYFAQKGATGEALNQEITRYAERVLARSRQSRRHSRALKQIVGRFSAQDLKMLDEMSRRQWHALIAQHAQALEQQCEALRRELQPVFFPTGLDQKSAQIEITSDADLLRTVARLFELASEIDDAVRRSFSVSGTGPQSVAVRGSLFNQSLHAAKNIAARIVAVARP